MNMNTKKDIQSVVPKHNFQVDLDRIIRRLERTGEVLALRYDAAAGTFRTIASLGGFYRPVALVVTP